MTRMPTGSLVITVGKEGPHWEGKWRWQGRQIKRRIGPAWLVAPNGSHKWVKRAGRPKEGFLSREDAIVALREMIAQPRCSGGSGDGIQIDATFAQAAEGWYAASRTPPAQADDAAGLPPGRNRLLHRKSATCC